MARRGDGIYLRGKTWYLDFVHEGQRHVGRIGKGINRTGAGVIAQAKRTKRRLPVPSRAFLLRFWA